MTAAARGLFCFHNGDFQSAGLLLCVYVYVRALGRCVMCAVLRMDVSVTAVSAPSQRARACIVFANYGTNEANFRVTCQKVTAHRLFIFRRRASTAAEGEHVPEIY